MTDKFTKLAQKIVVYVGREYDDDITVEDVMDWFMDCDEDDLVAQNVATLADWFMETH